MLRSTGSFRDRLARAARSTLSSSTATAAATRGQRPSQQFYAEVLATEREMGVAVAHETHRGRILYNPWATRDLLRLFPISSSVAISATGYASANGC